MGTTKVNVHQVERNISVLLGGLLLLRSIMRSSLGGTVLAMALLYRGISGHSYLYQLLGVATCKQGESGTSNGALEIERSITIEKPANELYRFWHEPKNLSQVMADFVEITPISENRAHWQVRAPFAPRMQWDTQLVEDRFGEVMRWKSLDGGALSEGAVSFHPAPRDWGTETTLRLRFNQPGGILGGWMAKRLSIVPSRLVEKALRRFKSLVETGEIPTLEHNPSARPEFYADYHLLYPLRRVQ